jgi:drug/metabolite transporter (DMT)-like permease
MAVAATLLAYLAQTWAQRFTSPVRTGLLFAVEPLAAVHSACSGSATA